MRGFVLGVTVTMVAVVATVYLYFAAGIAPIATSAPPMPFEKQFARIALNARLKKETPSQVPVRGDEANLVAGVHIYVEQCAVCHGVPGKAETVIAEGEFPRPPQLFSGKGVTDDEPGKTYWKVANGSITENN